MEEGENVCCMEMMLFTPAPPQRSHLSQWKMIFDMKQREQQVFTIQQFQAKAPTSLNWSRPSASPFPLSLSLSLLCFVKIPDPDDLRDREIPGYPGFFPHTKSKQITKKPKQRQKFIYKFFWQFFQMTHIDENIDNSSLSCEFNAICKHNCSVFRKKFDFSWKLLKVFRYFQKSGILIPIPEKSGIPGSRFRD